MSNFLGGSAFSMARDIADGYHLVTERTLKKLSPAELEQLAFEMDRCLREVRGEQVPLDDLVTIQHRNRKIQRMTTAFLVLRTYQSKIRRRG